MQFKVMQFEVEITQAQAQGLNDTVIMQLGRYAQIIDVVHASFTRDVDQFGEDTVNCCVEIRLSPVGQTSASNTATNIEDAFYNSVSRAKRQLDRQRGSSKRQFTPSYILSK